MGSTLGSEVQIEDGSLGKYADVTVRIHAGSEEARPYVIAFEVYMTGESKEIRGIAKGLEVFDQIVVCANTRPALESLKFRAIESLGSEILDKVSFHLISQYLTSTTQVGASDAYMPFESPSEPLNTASGTIREDLQIREQILFKSPTKSETEVEPKAATSDKKRGRPQKTTLMDRVGQAYVHLHDLDWLQECDLARLPEVQEIVEPNRMMPEAQALRSLLIVAADQVIEDLNPVPGSEGVVAFLTGYLAGRSVAEIAQEIGVSREWCSRNFRREALRQAGVQFVRYVSLEN